MATKSTFKLKVNEKYKFELDKDMLSKQDIIPIGNNSYHTIVNNTSVLSKIISSDIAKKELIVDVGGVEYKVDIKDSFDQLIKDMGLSANVVKKLSEIKAPMPGLVLDIMVKEGDQLQEGDSIMILEAMKMENVIKAPGDMIIKEVLIKKGDAVDKNQLLINLDS